MFSPIREVLKPSKTNFWENLIYTEKPSSKTPKEHSRAQYLAPPSLFLTPCCEGNAWKARLMMKVRTRNVLVCFFSFSLSGQCSLAEMLYLFLTKVCGWHNRVAHHRQCEDKTHSLSYIEGIYDVQGQAIKTQRKLL